ncbi:MAG: hypothetical protein JWL83_3294 [Actinomycetia bacterium]|nr:hypothetical protein [Actinomycetes bacterium]
MGAAGYRFRSELRTRWVARTALAVLIGIVAATVLVFAAGSRRTGSAHGRFVGVSNGYDIAVGTFCRPMVLTTEVPSDPALQDSCHDTLARLPSVATAATVGELDARIETLDGRSVQPDSADECYSCPGDVGLLSADSSTFGRSLNHRRFVAGRDANAGRADEVVLSQATATRMHLGPGDRLSVRLFGNNGCTDPSTWGQPIVVRIVGVQLSPGEVRPPSGLYLQSLEVTKAFVHATGAQLNPYLAVRLRSAATVADFKEQAKRVGDPVQVVADAAANGAAVGDAIRPNQVSLALLALLTGLAAAAIFGQVIARQAVHESNDDVVLAALGMGRRDRLALSALRGTVLGVVAAGVAVGLAIAASPIMPMGIARRIEPHRGFAFDFTTYGAGALVVVVFIVLVTGLATLRLPTVRAGQERTEHAALSHVAARARLSLSAVLGARYALRRGAGTTAVPVISSFGSLTIAVAAIIGALTFSASLAHLRATPSLVGWNWDLVVTLPQDEAFGPMSDAESRERVRRAFEHDAQVVGYTPGMIWAPFPQGRPLEIGRTRVQVSGFLALDGKGPIRPSVIDGREPTAADEIVLGPETLAAVGAHIGDDIGVFGQAGPWDKPGKETSAHMRVVGTAVVPMAEQLGMGAVLTTAGAAKLNSLAQDQAYFIRLAPGTDVDTVLSTFRHAFPEARPDSMSLFGYGGGADPLLKLDTIESVPSVFALVIALMGIAVLAHVLMVAASAQRRDFAILRALGFSRAQTARTIAWQATIYALVAVAVGSPIGFFAGRLAWQAYARGLDVVPDSAMSWSTWAITAAGMLLLAALVAVPAAGRVIRTRSATVLHAD